MARKSSSSIYGTQDYREALDIADRSLKGEILHASDAFGLVPSLLGEIKPDVTVHNKGESSSHDKARTHDGEITGGSDKVTNDRQRHEKTPVDLHEAGAEAFREQRGGPREDED